MPNDIADKTAVEPTPRRRRFPASPIPGIDQEIAAAMQEQEDKREARMRPNSPRADERQT